MYIFNHEQLHFLKCLHSFTPGTAAKTRGAVLDSRTQPDFLRLSLSRIQDDSSLCMPLKAAYSVYSILYSDRMAFKEPLNFGGHGREVVKTWTLTATQVDVGCSEQDQRLDIADSTMQIHLVLVCPDLEKHCE